MSKNLYRPKKRSQKEPLTILDRIEITGVVAASVILLGWGGFSVVKSFIPQPEIPTYEVCVDDISSYLDKIGG